MKMNRRSLLKLLSLAPLAAVLPVKAARKITNVDVGSATPEQLTGLSRGKLWVLVGPRKIGKTSLAKAMAELTTCRWKVIDEYDYNGLKRLALLHGYGSTENRLVVLSEGRKAFPEAALENCLGSSIQGGPQIAALADMVIRVEGWACHQDGVTGKITRSWHCRILKSRYGATDQASVHYIHRNDQLDAVFGSGSDNVISCGWQKKSES